MITQEQRSFPWQFISLQNVFAINFKLLVGYPKNKFQSNFWGNENFMISSVPHVPVQGRRRAANRFSQLPYPSFGVDP
jgi:hypothetical protein